MAAAQAEIRGPTVPEQAIRVRPDGVETAFAILVLEDSRFEQARIRRACQATGLPVSVTLASRLEEFGPALEARRYDMILIDYLLPSGDGLEGQRMVRESALNFAAPVVVISSQMRLDVAVTAMKEGCLDCMGKEALDADKLRELLIASTQATATAAQGWISALLERQREEVIRSVAQVVRDEMQYGRFIDTIDLRIREALDARGVTEPVPIDARPLLDADEPFRFR